MNFESQAGNNEVGPEAKNESEAESDGEGQRGWEGVLSHCGLLDMSGIPLLYSPAFCRLVKDLTSQRPEAEFTGGG